MAQLQPVLPQAPKFLNVAKRPRPTPFAVNKPLEGFREEQDWLLERFVDLRPEDFTKETLAIYTLGLTAPSGFDHVWQSIREHHRVGGVVPAEEGLLLWSARILLVFANINDERQMEDVRRLSCFFRSFYENRQSPRVILVQHSVKPTSCQVTGEDSQYRALVDVLKHGVHDAIIDEKSSFELTLAVRSRFLHREAVQQEFRECILVTREMVEWKQDIEWHIDNTFWDYLRVRLQTNLPVIDPSIAPGEPTEIDGVQIGACVGSGATGVVHKLMNAGESTGHVLKRIPKRRISSIRGLEHLRQEIQVMHLISSELWEHPNVVKLHNIYHSQTHVFFRMEDGGSRNLYTRLRHRDNKRSPLNMLSSDKAQAICSQIISAIAHLHTGPKIVHGDIKPENILLTETADDVHITIADFDTAVVEPQIPCMGIVGTYPMMAPEILLHEMYNPYAADVWSMAVVFLEVACGAGILEKALDLPRLAKQASRSAVKMHQKKMASIIHQFFSQADATATLLEDNIRPELRDVMSFLAMALPGMLNVTIESRTTSSELFQAFCTVGDESDIKQ